MLSLFLCNYGLVYLVEVLKKQTNKQKNKKQKTNTKEQNKTKQNQTKTKPKQNKNKKQTNHENNNNKNKIKRKKSTVRYVPFLFVHVLIFDRTYHVKLVIFITLSSRC